MGRPQRSADWRIILAVIMLCGLAFALRCLHLLNDDHYFIVSPDSHFFHRMAELLVQDQTYFYPTQGRLLPVPMFSGITYPLAVMARVGAVVAPASAADTVEVVSRLLPPALGAVTVLVLYLAVSRVYGRMAGLFCAFAWAVVPMGIMHQAAGYLDRDCLSMVIVIGGVFLFFFLGEWRWPGLLGRWNWAGSLLAVVAVEVVLYVQWGFLGPAIVVAVLVGFASLRIIKDVAGRIMAPVLAEEDPVRMLLVFGQGCLRAWRWIIEDRIGRSVAVLLCLNLIAAAFRPEVFRSIRLYFDKVFGGAVAGEQTISELQGVGLNDILSYSFLLIPVVIGIYVCARRWKSADVLVLGWFAVLFLAGLFARRLFIYAAPAACILSAVGFTALLRVNDFRPSLSEVLALPFVNPRGLVPYIRVGAVVVVVLLVVLVSTTFGYWFASTPPISADRDWHEALIWLRDGTEEDAVILTHWNYGYWILDIADRVPVVDNGYHPESRDTDIARVYCALDDLEAISVMAAYHVDYLIFSREETKLLPNMSLVALNTAYGDGTSIPEELEESLYSRSFSQTFRSDAGLERVYPSAIAADTALVILAVR